MTFRFLFGLLVRGLNPMCSLAKCFMFRRGTGWDGVDEGRRTVSGFDRLQSDEALREARGLGASQTGAIAWGWRVRYQGVR